MAGSIHSYPQFFIDHTPLPQQDVKAIEEDPDVSQDVWETKTMDLFHDVYNPHQLLEHLHQSQEVIPMYDALKSYPFMKKATIVRSFKHLTLPEALLYYEIMFGKVSDTFSATLSIQSVFSVKNPLCLELVLRKNNTTVMKRFRIEYNIRSLVATLFVDGLRVGKVSFVIRNNKLEEIKGTYHGKPFILDPVWHPFKKGVLREEHVTFGPYTATLTTQHNEKKSVYTLSQTASLSVKQKKTLQKDAYRTITTKQVQFSDYKGTVQLVFFKGILTPLLGQWHFKKK